MLSIGDAIDPAAPTMEAGPAPLIAYLIERYHEVHRAELQVLCPLARRIEAEHADHPDCPRGLADFLESFAIALNCHMRREEIVLFPMLTGRAGPMISLPLMTMMDEHEDQHDRLDKLTRLALGFVPPADAPVAWRRLYAGLAKLGEDLRRHIYLEDEVLFRRFLSKLSFSAAI
jgi:regulator of cell morphogenesis and NO signaling